MKKIITILLMTVSVTVAYTQKSITLWQCYDSAAVATPLAGEKDIYADMTILNDRNLVSGWLPTPDLNGSASYQSDVVDMSDIFSSLPVSISSIPSIPHGQYRATLDINQVIWDGGVTRNAREVEKVVSELNMKQNEADIYRLREQVNNYFFSILLVRSQIEVTGLLISELDARIAEITSAINNGVVTAVSLDVLKAGKIEAEQAVTELCGRHDALAAALEQLTGISGIKDAELLLPDVVITGNEVINNPDMQLLDISSQQLELSKNMLKSSRMPKAFGYAQAGYGNPPGNNFLSDCPDVFYSFGAGFKWNIFDWNRNSNERQILTLRQQLLAAKKSATEESLQRLQTVKMAEITSLREAGKRDAELIEIRKNISAVSASQLNNGTITASEYLTELNNERQAVISSRIRMISIARAEIEYLYITGYNK